MSSGLSTNPLTDLLFEQENDFLGVYDVQLNRYVRVNQAWVRLMGFTTEQQVVDLTNSSFRTNPLSSEERNQMMTNLIREGAYDEEAELIRANGETFWGRLTVTLYETGQLALVRITNLDRLHRTERELDHSVQRYEAVYANATIGIIVADKAGQIVSANQLADQLFGYGTGKLVGLSIEQLVPSAVSQYHQKLRETFNENPHVRAMGHNRDLYAQRQDGSLFPVEISLSYFRLDDALYAVAYIIDITFKREAENQLIEQKAHVERLNTELEQKVADRTHALMNTLEQLERSKDELARALKTERELGELKSSFVSMASHEFRTPLTAVLNSTTLIEKYPATDQQDKRLKHLHRIRTSVKHLNAILEEFLSVGKLDEGKVAAQPVEVNLPQLVEETVLDMQSLLKTGQVIQTDIDCPHPIWLDSSLLRKIMVNLLSNASKYSKPETIIKILVNAADQQLTLAVIDQGIGIAPDDQQHLFEQFFRAKNSGNVPGTGLGLHIVAKYVELMNGSITLQSELNKGSTLTITLPYEDHPLN